MSCEEAEALGLLREKHLAEVSVSETDLAVLGNRAGNAECLKSDTDSGSSVGSLGAALLDSDSAAYGVSPYSVLKADRLGLSYDLVAVDSLSKGYIPALFNRGNAVFGENGIDFVNSSFIIFKQSHALNLPITACEGQCT